MAEDEVTKRADELYASVSEMHVCNVKTLEQTFGGERGLLLRHAARACVRDLP